jgi:hypothetical protein
MFLQEIFKPEYSELTDIYGLDINSESSDTKFSRPPQNFEVIGFNLKLGDDNLIDEQLLDLIISYKLTNIMVVLDVPSQFISQGLITPKNLIQLANNVDFSISLLPPKHPLVGDSITLVEYVEIIRLFNEEMMAKQNFDKMVAPISNFLEYLMLEKLLGKEHPAIKNFSPNNEYVQANFLPYMTNEDSNMFKDVIRESLYNFYGGEEQFDLVATTIFEGIYNKSHDVFSGYVQEHIQQSKLQIDSETPT